MIIREGRPEDSSVLAELAGQLGYPVSREEMESRVLEVQGNERHAVFVVEDEAAGIVGWIHVLIYELLVIERRAVIGGLVVEKKFRRRGIATGLMRRAESWARKTGCRSVNVKSNTDRPESHPFYLSLGYRRVKTQHSYQCDF